MSPQVYEYTMNRMFGLGAFEVFWNPVPMKENRPGRLITIICRPDLARVFGEALLRETTAKGLRWRFEYKLREPAEIVQILIRYGLIRCKVAKKGYTIINTTPEHEDCKRIALDTVLR